MNRTFAITAANEVARLANDGKGEASFTVTNSAARQLRGRLRARPLDSTKAEWLSIAGETERNFSPNATQQVSIKISVPQGIPAGKYLFRLDAVSVTNPDDDFTEGPVVSMEVQTAEAPKRPFPWWIIALTAGVVVIIGLLVWALTPSRVEVPPVVGLKLEEARKKLEEAKFKVEIVKQADAAATLGLIFKQEPEAGSKAKVGSDVNIYINEKGEDKATVVFEENFDGTVSTNWSSTATTRAPSGETRFLGRFTSDTVMLELDNLPSHKTVTVGFDLYIIQTWDGNKPYIGPDNWGMKQDGGPVLIYTSFINSKEAQQNFACKEPETEFTQCPQGPVLGFTGAVRIGALGYVTPGWPPPAYTDATYKIKRVFNHSKTYLKLAFFGELREQNATGQAYIHNVTENESWGLDNVRVEVK